MSFPYYVRSAAELEISHALDYYALNAPYKLADLEQAIIEAVDRMVDAPTRLRARFRNARCEFVRGFQYQVWYVWNEEHEVAEVIAFLHGRQSRAALGERH